MHALYELVEKRIMQRSVSSLTTCVVHLTIINKYLTLGAPICTHWRFEWNRGSLFLTDQVWIMLRSSWVLMQSLVFDAKLTSLRLSGYSHNLQDLMQPGKVKLICRRLAITTAKHVFWLSLSQFGRFFSTTGLGIDKRLSKIGSFKKNQVGSNNGSSGVWYV